VSVHVEPLDQENNSKLNFLRVSLKREFTEQISMIQNEKIDEFQVKLLSSSNNVKNAKSKIAHAIWMKEAFICSFYH
jgi:hypothetical protein